MTTSPISNDDFFTQLEAALPVDDLVRWLLDRYPGVGEYELKRLLTLVYQRDYHITPASSQENLYRVGESEWNACPQRVEPAR